MKQPRRARCARAALLLVALACGGEPDAEAPRAPLGIQGDVVVEPPTLRIGQTATVEVAVVTPPEHGVSPPEAPAEVPGLWVLEAETLPVEREPQRWIHRTRFLVRARATGSFAWPAQTLRVESLSEEGAVRQALELPERALEVREVSGEWPDRLEPFGLRRRAPAGATGGALVPALAGALTALAAVGLVALVRRARAAGDEPARAAADDREAWRAAQATLAAAEASDDPRAAADAASAALRIYLTRRHAAAADTATTEELAAREAPWGLARSWPQVLSVLRRLDDVRFRPREAPAAGASEVRAAVREARALLGESPPRGRRP